MKIVYDVYYSKVKPTRLMRKGLTKEQIDRLWSELKWWEKVAIDVKERRVEEVSKQER